MKKTVEKIRRTKNKEKSIRNYKRNKDEEKVKSQPRVKRTKKKKRKCVWVGSTH